jgi:hypothetical protein
MPCRCRCGANPAATGTDGVAMARPVRLGSLSVARAKPQPAVSSRLVSAIVLAVPVQRTDGHRAFVLGAHGWVPEALTLIRHGTPREGSGRTRSHGQRRRRVRADGHGEDLTRRLWPGAATCCFRARKRASPRTRATLPHRFRPTGEAICRRTEPASTAQSESRPSRQAKQGDSVRASARRERDLPRCGVEWTGEVSTATWTGLASPCRRQLQRQRVAAASVRTAG